MSNIKFKLLNGRYIPRYGKVSNREANLGPKPAIYTINKAKNSRVAMRQPLRLKKYASKFPTSIGRFTNNIPVDLSKAIIDNLGKVPNSNLMISGPSGMGKTESVFAVSNALIDHGIPVVYVNEMVDLSIVRKLCESSNGKNIALVFDDIHRTYSGYKGLDDFIAFLSDPLMSHVIALLTCEEGSVKYTRLNVVDGRPSRAYYRVNLTAINLIKTPGVIEQIRKEANKLKGKKWRLELIDKYFGKILVITNYDVINRMAEVILTSETMEGAEARLPYINKSTEKREGVW